MGYVGLFTPPSGTDGLDNSQPTANSAEISQEEQCVDLLRMTAALSSFNITKKTTKNSRFIGVNSTLTKNIVFHKSQAKGSRDPKAEIRVTGYPAAIKGNNKQVYAGSIKDLTRAN